MWFTSTDILCDAPEGLTYVDDGDYKYGRTADGRYYASARLGCNSTARVDFHLYVELSEADWTALREGRAKFVTGRIEDELPRELFGQEFLVFEPRTDETVAAGADYDLYRPDGLSSVFEALAEREVA